MTRLNLGERVFYDGPLDQVAWVRCWNVHTAEIGPYSCVKPYGTMREVDGLVYTDVTIPDTNFVPLYGINAPYPIPLNGPGNVAFNGVVGAMADNTGATAYGPTVNSFRLDANFNGFTSVGPTPNLTGGVAVRPCQMSSVRCQFNNPGLPFQADVLNQAGAPSGFVITVQNFLTQSEIGVAHYINGQWWIAGEGEAPPPSVEVGIRCWNVSGEVAPASAVLEPTGTSRLEFGLLHVEVTKPGDTFVPCYGINSETEIPINSAGVMFLSDAVVAFRVPGPLNARSFGPVANQWFLTHERSGFVGLGDVPGNVVRVNVSPQKVPTVNVELYEDLLFEGEAMADVLDMNLNDTAMNVTVQSSMLEAGEALLAGTRGIATWSAGVWWFIKDVDLDYLPAFNVSTTADINPYGCVKPTGNTRVIGGVVHIDVDIPDNQLVPIYGIVGPTGILRQDTGNVTFHGPTPARVAGAYPDSDALGPTVGSDDLQGQFEGFLSFGDDVAPGHKMVRIRPMGTVNVRIADGQTLTPNSTAIFEVMLQNETTSGFVMTAKDRMMIPGQQVTADQVPRMTGEADWVNGQWILTSSMCELPDETANINP